MSPAPIVVMGIKNEVGVVPRQPKVIISPFAGSGPSRAEPQHHYSFEILV
jgi:hypothetical protein